MSIINQNEGYIKGKLMSRVNPLYGKKIKKISCGDGFTVFLDCDGTLYSCGKNNKGQLGYDIPYEKAEIISGIKCQSHPKFIEYFMENKIKIIDIVCGSDFSFAIDETNQIYSWGSNDHYQLARGINKLSESKPGLAILVTPCESIVKVCCGWMHGCYLTDKGEVYIWGNPYYDYDRTYSDIQDPIKVEMENRCVDISSGFHHIAIITQDENIFSLFTLGANEFGQLGYETDKEISVIPHMVDFKGTSVMDVVCGSFHTMCLLANEKIFGFGSN